MTKHSSYIRFTLIILVIVLGWQIMDKTIFKKEVFTPLEIALQSAESNRPELEKVLHYYLKNPADSLKFKAACFLIENMPFYSYSVGKNLNNYKTYYNGLKKSRKSPEEISDSIKEAFGPIGELHRKRDIREVDSAYLCNNIEWSFKVWKEQPWNKNLSFEAFCEYLLPYRIDNEPLAYWRKMYYEKYNSLLDSLRVSDSLDYEDPIVAANYLINKLPDKNYRYTGTTPIPFEHIGPEHVQYLTGSCKEVTDFGIYMFRALGIPCAMNFIPARSSVNAGHFWIISWDKHGEDYLMDFPGNLDKVRKNWWYRWDSSSKIYQYTFSVNKKLFEEIASYGEAVYPFWNLPKFIDVTHKYAHHYKKELRIPSSKLYSKNREGKIAYLCLSNRDKWIPVDWTKYDKDNLVFRNIKKGTTMRVATYEHGTLQFVTDPFYCNQETNEFYFYSATKDKQDIVLYAKCGLGDEYIFRSRMVGGIFEGSNQPDFTASDTLFIIQKKPNRLSTTVQSWSNKKYRYLRYVGPNYSACNVAELAFYEPNHKTKIKGKVIGTPGSYQNDGKHEYTNAFDGKTWTSFDYIESNGGWTGLDVGREVQVDRIVYSPRNRDNYIRIGDSYELFYCDGNWKSAGRIQATTDSLVFRNIPKNLILRLRNHTRGVDERIFTYENGIQIWK